MKTKMKSSKTIRAKKLKSINPYTGEVMKEFDLMQPKEIERKVSLAREAFGLWRAVPASERARHIKRLAGHLKNQKIKYAELITMEMGKPIRESIAEIEKCAWLCEYFSENGPKLLEPENIRTEAVKSYVRYDPLGIVLAIMPWNFPFWQAFRFGIPAICAGNVVLLKHASNVPQTALAIDKAFSEAGFPEWVFTTLLIDSKTAIRLIDDDLVDAVSLTGSNKAGEEVGAHAGAKIKKLVLELGGSDPFIILDDAEIPKAATMAVNARIINAGQSCIAAKRIIVLKKVADEFKKHFGARLMELKMGDPLDRSTDIGPLAKKDIFRAVEAQLADAEQKGAEIIQAGQSSFKKLIFPPSAVFRPSREMRVLNEEVFGPVAPVIIVKDEEEAVKVANDTHYGLGASIWSRNHRRAEKLAARLEAGFIAINDMVKSDPRMPFGGVKKSGIGRELSHYGLREFVNIKSVIVKE